MVCFTQPKSRVLFTTYTNPFGASNSCKSILNLVVRIRFDFRGKMLRPYICKENRKESKKFTRKRMCKGWRNRLSR